MSPIRTALTALAPALVAALGISSARADERCFADWSTAAPVVRAEALISQSDMHAQARKHNLGDLLRIRLCTDNGGYVYRLLVRTPAGEVVPLIVDAREPVVRGAWHFGSRATVLLHKD